MNDGKGEGWYVFYAISSLIVLLTKDCVKDDAIIEQEQREAIERRRREEEERALAAQRERERLEKEEKERQQRVEQERIEREKKEKVATRGGGSGVRGVRGTRASMRGMRGAGRGEPGEYEMVRMILSSLLTLPYNSDRNVNHSRTRSQSNSTRKFCSRFMILRFSSSNHSTQDFCKDLYTNHICILTDSLNITAFPTRLFVDFCDNHCKLPMCSYIPSPFIPNRLHEHHLAFSPR
jgi:hypothetical protein